METNFCPDEINKRIKYPLKSVVSSANKSLLFINLFDAYKFSAYQS